MNEKVSVDVQTTIQILEKIDQYWVKVSLFLKKSLNIEYAMLFHLLIYLNKEISCHEYNVNTQLHAPEQDLSEQIYESNKCKIYLHCFAVCTYYIVCINI